MLVLDEDSLHKPPADLEAVAEEGMEHIEPLQCRTSVNKKNKLMVISDISYQPQAPLCMQAAVE